MNNNIIDNINNDIDNINNRNINNHNNIHITINNANIKTLSMVVVRNVVYRNVRQRKNSLFR